MEDSSSPEPSQERREWSAPASSSMTAGVSCLPLACISRVPRVLRKVNEKPSHFLDLLRDCCLPSEVVVNIEKETEKEIIHEKPSHILDLLRDYCLPFEEHARRKREEVTVDIEKEYISSGYDRTIPSAVELRNAGVKFTRATENLFMAMKFSSDGVFQIPLLTIDGYTEVLLRNLVAFEQCFEPVSELYISGYVRHLDSLINSPNDVVVLRRRGVIQSMTEDERVSNLFNNILKGAVIDTRIEFYKAVATEVKKYYNKPWNKFKAMLLREYFYSPWASASSIAVIIVVICTIVQTFGTFFG